MQSFTPSDGSFTVEMPLGVEHTHDSVLSNEPFIGENYQSVGAPLYFYWVNVACANQPNSQKLNPDAYYWALFGEASRGRRVSKQRISVDGFTGGEIVSTKRDDAMYIHWIVAGPRVYLLSLIGPGDEGEAPAARRFFASFHINHPANTPLPGCPNNEGRLPTATIGKIRLLVWPDYWKSSKKGEENVVHFADWLEVRSRRASLDEEWLFGALNYYDPRYKSDPDWFARNFYAVQLNEPSNVTDLSPAEWNRARVISTQATEVFWGDDKKPAKFEYHGYKYDKASEHWGTVTVSPGGRWVLIHSYSGKNTEPFLWGGGLPREGDVFWDVYDSATGQRVLSWTARYVANPGLSGHGVAWIADRYVVMPFGSFQSACVIGVLPVK